MQRQVQVIPWRALQGGFVSQATHRIIFPALAAVLSLVGFALLASLPEPATRAAPNALVNVKLSGEMQPEGDVAPFYDFYVSPDGRYAVYNADAETDEDLNLYSVLTTGESSPVRLNGRESPGRIVGITPDSERVVYLARAGAGIPELYVVPIDGSDAPLDLNAPVGTTTDNTASGSLSPDGSRVVYRYENEDDERELHSVPVDGGPVVKLNAGPVADAPVGNFKISPNGDRVIFRVLEQDPLLNNWYYALYSVSITGGTPVKLNAPLVTGGSVWNYAISTTGRVVYQADQQVNDRFELYSVPITGGLVTKLNPPLVSGGDVDSGIDFGPEPFQISPDGDWVVYMADQNVDDQFELFSVPAAGGQARQVNGFLVPEGRVWDFAVSPDSNRVVYHANQETDSEYNLYSAKIDNGGSISWIRLNNPFVEDGYVRFFDFSPDGSRVVFAAYQNNVKVLELFSVPAVGGSVITISGPRVVYSSFAQTAVISPNGQQVAYRGSETDDVYELYRVPINGGPVEKMNGELVAGGDVDSRYMFTSDSERLIYIADQEVDEQFELFATFDDSLLPTPTPTATATVRPTTTPTVTATTQPPVGEQVYLPAVVR